MHISTNTGCHSELFQGGGGGMGEKTNLAEIEGATENDTWVLSMSPKHLHDVLECSRAFSCVL